MSLFNLTGRTALITGAAGGIGEATARLFAKAGAALAVVRRTGSHRTHPATC